MSDFITKTEVKKLPVELVSWDLCEKLSKSALVPAHFLGNREDKYPPDVVAANLYLAVTHGGELGLSPAQSIQGVCVVNGRAAVYADTLIAVLRASGEFVGKDWVETWDAKTSTATCAMGRKGGEKRTASYSLEKARALGVANRNPLYRSVPETMLKWRARHEVARELFADVLKGVGVTQVIEDDALLVDDSYIEAEIIDQDAPEAAPEPATEEGESSPAPDSPEEETAPESADMDDSWGNEPEPEPAGNEDLMVALGKDKEGKPDWKTWYADIGNLVSSASDLETVIEIYKGNELNVAGFEKAHPGFHKRLLEQFGQRKKALS